MSGVMAWPPRGWAQVDFLDSQDRQISFTVSGGSSKTIDMYINGKLKVQQVKGIHATGTTVYFEGRGLLCTERKVTVVGPNSSDIIARVCALQQHQKMPMWHPTGAIGERINQQVHCINGTACGLGSQGCLLHERTPDMPEPYHVHRGGDGLGSPFPGASASSLTLPIPAAGAGAGGPSSPSASASAASALRPAGTAGAEACSLGAEGRPPSPRSSTGSEARQRGLQPLPGQPQPRKSPRQASSQPGRPPQTRQQPPGQQSQQLPRAGAGAGDSDAMDWREQARRAAESAAMAWAAQASLKQEVKAYQEELRTLRTELALFKSPGPSERGGGPGGDAAAAAAATAGGALGSAAAASAPASSAGEPSPEDVESMRRCLRKMRLVVDGECKQMKSLEGEVARLRDEVQKRAAEPIAESEVRRLHDELQQVWSVAEEDAKTWREENSALKEALAKISKDELQSVRDLIEEAVRVAKSENTELKGQVKHLQGKLLEVESNAVAAPVVSCGSASVSTCTPSSAIAATSVDGQDDDAVARLNEELEDLRRTQADRELQFKDEVERLKARVMELETARDLLGEENTKLRKQAAQHPVHSPESVGTAAASTAAGASNLESSGGSSAWLRATSEGSGGGGSSNAGGSAGGGAGGGGRSGWGGSEEDLELETLREQVRSLEAQCHEVQRTKARLKVENCVLQTRVVGLEDTVEATQHVASETLREAEELKRKVNEAEAKHVRMDIERSLQVNRQFHTHASELETQLEREHEEKEVLASRAASMRKHLDAYHQMIEESFGDAF